MDRVTRIAALLGVLAFASPAFADDVLKIAAGQRGSWETGISDLGQRAGIFKRHGLELQIVYTQGSGETQQAVISGSETSASRSAAWARSARSRRARRSARSAPP